jgi:hypothetical protein
MSNSNDNTWRAAAVWVLKGLAQTQKDLIKDAFGKSGKS